MKSVSLLVCPECPLLTHAGEMEVNPLISLALSVMNFGNGTHIQRVLRVFITRRLREYKS